MSDQQDEDAIELDLMQVNGGLIDKVDQALIYEVKSSDVPAYAPVLELKSPSEVSAVQLAKELGYSEALTVGALEDGIRFYQGRTAEACLELGKRLLLLKELTGHGEFKKRVELLGFNYRAAARFMKSAKKVAKSDNLSLLVPKLGAHQKLIEFLMFDDEELEEILSGGTDVTGISLDEIELMSATELRKKLRAYKEGKLTDEKAKPLLNQIESLHKQISNHEKHYSELEIKHEATERKLKQLINHKKPGHDAVSIDTAAIREEAYALEYGASVYLTALKALLIKTLHEPAPNLEEAEMRIDAVSIAVSGIYLAIDHLFTDLQESRGTDAMPPALAGKHVLTNDEKQRLVDCKLMIDHDFNVKKSGRELRRDEENRRPSGRPAGSGNKGK